MRTYTYTYMLHALADGHHVKLAVATLASAQPANVRKLSATRPALLETERLRRRDRLRVGAHRGLRGAWWRL